MVVIKSLLPFMLETEKEKILFFYNQENHEVFCQNEISDQLKKDILSIIEKQVFEDQSTQIDITDLLSNKIDLDLADIKEQHDSGKYEIPDIKHQFGEQ
jgi:hypothetical protein